MDLIVETWLLIGKLQLSFSTKCPTSSVLVSSILETPNVKTNVGLQSKSSL